jgi:hypothetical protein
VLSPSARQACDWHGYGDAEELRMLAVIAQFAVDEALIHGAYGAAFRGFRIRAVREVTLRAICVKLIVTGRAGMCSVDAAPFCTMNPDGDDCHERKHVRTQLC